jgi:hypothetical protein
MIKVEIPQHLLTEEWVRLPKPQERLEGLSRTTILELHAQGDVKIAAIRKAGSQKAIRLVHIPSLKAYLETCVEEPRLYPGRRKGRSSAMDRPKYPNASLASRPEEKATLTES